MNTMLTTLMAALLASAMLLHAESASADKPDAAATRVAGEKLDSGLGELPHYRHWADPKGKAPLGNHVAGQKLDSGLGELPPYRLWADPTGRTPVRTEQIAANAGSRR